MRGVSRESLAALSERLGTLAGGAEETAVRVLVDDLFSVVHLLDEQPRLRRVVSDPALPGRQRAGLLGSLLGGRISAPAAELVEALASARWAHPRDVVDATDELAAQALFTLAERDESLDDVEDELFRFARILDREPGLRAALTDPALPGGRKRALLDELLGAKVRTATATLVTEVVLHPRGRTIDGGLEDYARLAAARRDRLVARVRTVVPLTEEQATRLGEALAGQLGRRVHLNVEIDPDLVGGISVRVGDELFDGSIAYRIAQARRRMTR